MRTPPLQIPNFAVDNFVTFFITTLAPTSSHDALTYRSYKTRALTANHFKACIFRDLRARQIPGADACKLAKFSDWAL